MPTPNQDEWPNLYPPWLKEQEEQNLLPDEDRLAELERQMADLKRQLGVSST